VPLAHNFIARISESWDQFKRDLRKHRWGPFVLLLIAAIYALLEHRVLAATNNFIDSHVSLSGLKPIILAFGSSPFLHPIVVLAELFFGAILVLLAHAYWTTRSTKDAAPARIKVTTIELRRTLRLHGKKEAREVFLRAKVELSESLQVTVTRYRMELSRDGVFESLDFKNDLERWEITDWSHSPIPHDEMRPLPTTLKCGDLVEGWVHFATERSDRELDRSRVKFFVDTPLGTGSAEIAAGPEYWNVIPNRMIMEK